MEKKKIKLNFLDGSLNQGSAPKCFAGESVYMCPGLLKIAFGAQRP